MKSLVVLLLSFAFLGVLLGVDEEREEGHQFQQRAPGSFAGGGCWKSAGSAAVSRAASAAWHGDLSPSFCGIGSLCCSCTGKGSKDGEVQSVESQ